MTDNLLTRCLVVDAPDEVLGGTYRLAPDYRGPGIEVRARGFRTARDFALIGHPEDSLDPAGHLRWPTPASCFGIAWRPALDYDPDGIQLQGLVCGFPGVLVAVPGGLAASKFTHLRLSRGWLGVAGGGQRWDGAANVRAPSSGLLVDDVIGDTAWRYEGRQPDLVHLTHTEGTLLRGVRSYDFGLLKLSGGMQSARLQGCRAAGLNLQALGQPAWVPDERQLVEVHNCEFARGMDDREGWRHGLQLSGLLGLTLRDTLVANGLDPQGVPWPGAGVQAARDANGATPRLAVGGCTFERWSVPVGGTPSAAVQLQADAELVGTEGLLRLANTFVGCEPLVRF